MLRHRRQFPQLFEPVQNDVDARHRFWLSNNPSPHHEPVALGGNVVASDRLGCDIRSLKPHPSAATGERGFSTNVRHHELIRVFPESAVEQLISIRRPYGRRTLAIRNLTSGLSSGKRTNVDLAATCFVGPVRQPVPVRRECGVPLKKRRCLERRRFAVPVHGENHDVARSVALFKRRQCQADYRREGHT